MNYWYWEMIVSLLCLVALERLVEILQMHNPEDSPVTIRQLPSGTDDYLPLLKQIKVSLENRIIIDCTPEKVMELLRQATLVNMMEDYQVRYIQR